MVKGFVDTNIIVDLLRGHQAAQNWIASQQDLAITRAVWLEAIEGALDSHHQRLTLGLLNQFGLEELTVSDFDWAARQLLRFRLSHNVDAFDCLIAAPSYRLQLPLYTLNMKHFVPILAKLAVQPY